MNITDTSRSPLIFGIYPGGDAGSDRGIAAGPPANPVQIETALSQLAGRVEPFILRVYERYSDADAPSAYPTHPSQHFVRYLQPGRLFDLVVMFQSRRGDVPGFIEFLRSLIAQHGERLYSVQVTEEANFTHGPDCIDGPWPNVNEALVEGVKAAKREALRLGLRNLKVGFNSTPTFGSAAEFWSIIGKMGGPAFIESIDYVGLDFFPDVFRPAPKLRDAALGVLEMMRSTWLPAAGIPESVPIHVTEHGWPTGPDRPESRQAEVFECLVRAIAEARDRLNIARYTFFALRDAESFNPESAGNIFFHFGLMRSDYSPKLAFETCRQLIAQYGTAPKLNLPQ